MCEGNTSLILLNLWAKSDSVTIQSKLLQQNFYMVLLISQDYKEKFRLFFFHLPLSEVKMQNNTVKSTV